MKRFIWGIVLACFGALSVLGSVTGPSNPEALVGGGLMIAGGIALIYFGRQYIDRKNTATNIALQMLRQDDRIDAADLAHRMGLSEVEIREYLSDSQKRGVIPFKASIV